MSKITFGYDFVPLVHPHLHCSKFIKMIVKCANVFIMRKKYYCIINKLNNETIKRWIIEALKHPPIIQSFPLKIIMKIYLDSLNKIKTEKSHQQPTEIRNRYATSQSIIGCYSKR